MKSLKLKPSIREKKRYLLLEINNADLETNEISELIKRTILDFLGTFGYGKASPQILEIKQNIKNEIEVILAVNRKELDKVRAALCLSKTQICVKKVSGTLRKLRGK